MPVTVSIGGVAEPEQLRQTLRDRRLIVLFFDLTSLQPQDLTRSTDAAQKFLRTQMTAAGSGWAWWPSSWEPASNVISDFTNDRDMLSQAVDALLPGKESQLAALAAAAAQGNETGVTEDTDAAFTADDTEFNIFNTDRKLVALESMSDLLRDIPGKKAVIQFTGGITQTGEDNRSQLRVTTDAANRANVSIYTVDSRGLMAEIPGGDPSVGAATGNSMFSGASVFHQSDAREDSRDTLATLATDTGGRSFFDLGDFAPAFQSVQADSAGYYLLGYYSTNVARDGRWRTLNVRVNGVPGANIRYRDGYYAAKDFGVFTTEDRERQLEDAIRSETPVVELPIAVDTAYFQIDKGQVFVPISAKIAASALQWAQKSSHRQVNFDFAAEIRQAQSGRVVGALRDTITVNLDAERFQQLQQNALVYQGGIVLPPGDYGKLKFLARENERTGRIGTFEDELKLPSVATDHLQLSSVVLSTPMLVEDQKNSEVKTKKYCARQWKLAEGIAAGCSGPEHRSQRDSRFASSAGRCSDIILPGVPCRKPLIPNNLRAGIELFRAGRRVNQTPMVAPEQVDDKTRTASFRISLPLASVPLGSYTVQAVVVEAGGAHAAFGRNYFALRAEPATPAPATAPAATPPAAAAAANGQLTGN